MAIPTFPLPYVWEVEETSTYATRTVTFESQKKQIQRVAVNPLQTWKITCKGSPEQRLILKNFHDSVGGNSNVFNFVDPDGVTQVCRFAENKLTITDIREFDPTDVTHGKIVGFTAELTIEVAL
ncbi:hypothetical protein [Sporomusa aerivorans]|uniref:hypothetical protein n=1 Tax=Sporomusa aerivorans TaxID=204936 RepID=UPI00352A2F52